MAVSFLSSAHAHASAASSVATAGLGLTAGSNRIMVAIVHVFSLASAPANVTGVSRNGKSFTEVARMKKTWSTTTYGFAKTFVFYLLESNLDSGTHAITATMSEEVDYATIQVFHLAGVYQGAPFNHKQTHVENSNGPISVTLNNCFSDSIIVASFYNNEFTAGASGYASFGSFVTTTTNDGETIGSLPSPPFASTHSLHYRTQYGISSEGSVSVGASWTNSGTGDPMAADAFVFALEVTSTSWTAPLVVASAGCVNVFGTISSDITHLDGLDVAVLADGEVLRGYTISNAAITLPEEYGQIFLGIPYESDFETLNIEAPLGDGTTQGRKVKISNATFRLVNSRGGYIGPDEDHLYEAFTTSALASATQLDDVVGSGNARLFTCDIRVNIGAGYATGGRMFFRQVDPLPITIGAVVPEVTISQPTVK